VGAKVPNFSCIAEERWKKEEGRRKKEEGRRKKEEGRRKKEEGTMPFDIVG